MQPAGYDDYSSLFTYCRIANRHLIKQRPGNLVSMRKKKGPWRRSLQEVMAIKTVQPSGCHRIVIRYPIVALVFQLNG